jgi:hypothetical protein
MVLVAPQIARAEAIPGFSPGIWVFPERQAVSDSEIAALCRASLTIVTPPNDATTIAFEAIEGGADGKTLRGKTNYLENCPVIESDTVVCAGRDPSSDKLMPLIVSYSFKKIADGVYEVQSRSKETEPVTFFPRACPKAVIEELKAQAILPEGVALGE